MKILVTGGTGVIGTGLIAELLSRGHQVRLLSRRADEDVRRWKTVEAIAGDVGDATSIRGSAATCDAIVHVAGIAIEHPPDVTFERVNVEGTRNVVREAGRSSVRRLIFISSLGADRGATDYHRSKFAAEEIVRQSDLDWTILRPGAVYGPGDEVISNLLKMVRILPAVPVIADGEQQFQPIWFEDLARAIALIAESPLLVRQTAEIAGPDVTTLNDLLRRLGAITGRHPLRVPVPAPLATVATKIASKAIDVPFDETKLTMLRERNVVSGRNALEGLGIEATPLDAGLPRLADSLPEKLPEDGVGAMHHKHFHADIVGSGHTTVSLMTLFRERITELMPIEFASEPGAPTRIEQGVTMTGSLPLRGNFQVRVEVAEPARVVFGTIEGHPLAGIVEFTTAESGDAIRFAIDVFTRAGSVLDLVAERSGGSLAQTANWRAVVQNVIEASGGNSSGTQTETKTLDEETAAGVEKRVRAMVQRRQREESPDAERPAQR
jgi:NADH dehydrogenase